MFKLDQTLRDSFDGNFSDAFDRSDFDETLLLGFRKTERNVLCSSLYFYTACRISQQIN